LPRLISRPQEGSGEECGRGSNSPNFFCANSSTTIHQQADENLFQFPKP
jgi:hypothetical protein